MAVFSAEREIRRDLMGVRQIIKVNPQHVRFRLIKGDYVPYQITNTIVGGSGVNMKKLNQTTYRYIPHLQSNEVPYAIPPFLAVLDLLAIEKRPSEKLCKHRKEARNVLAFWQLTLKPPEALPGETEAAYQQRAVDYLNSQVSEMQKTISEGFAIGFKDVHEFKVEGSSINAQSAEKIQGLMDTLKMSGLKQDPNLLGKKQCSK